ncbi:MAG: hypothetical protein OXI83_13370, partial [Gemmatimonadota bacterium]|nr:hypothetical protein [Gemmatimonadota bacterium]
DEDPRYYAGKNAAPDSVDWTQGGLPEVVFLSVSQRQVKARSGYATQMEAVLTVAGAWVGGEVRVGRGTAESVRTVAQLTGANLSASWNEEPKGEITITAIPYHEGGLHPEGAKSVEWDFTPDYDIAPPTLFAVDVAADGTREFFWTPPEDPDLAGIVIRHLEGDVASPAWGAMTPLHQGVLTASPYETTQLDAGERTFLARALSISGEMSDTVRAFRNLTDPVGDDGVTIDSIAQNDDGSVTITYDTGNSVTIPPGGDGTDGVGISSTSRNAQTGVVTVTYTDGSTNTFTIEDGTPGADGSGAEWIYIATATDSRPSTPANPSDRTINDYVPSGWSDNPVLGRYVWVSKRSKPAGRNTTWGGFSTPAPFRGAPADTQGLAAANSTLPAIADSASTTATYAAVYAAPANVTVGEGTYTAVSISIRHTRGALSSTARTSVLVPYGTRSSPSRTSFTSEGGTSRSDPIALYGYWANRVLYLAVSGGVAIGSAAYHAATILQAAGTLAAAPTTGTRPGGTSPTSDTDTIYRRGSTTPTRPTGGTTSATALPAGWSRTDPGATATANVYISTRTRNYNINGDFTGATAWSAVSLHEAATGGGASSRTRTFYQRSSTAPAAPSSTAFGAYTSPGGGWSISDPGASATQGVYQVTLTQSFSSSTQSSSTFTGNSWSAVSLHEAATGTTTPTGSFSHSHKSWSRWSGQTDSVQAPTGNESISAEWMRGSAAGVYDRTFMYGPSHTGVSFMNVAAIRLRGTDRLLASIENDMELLIDDIDDRLPASVQGDILAPLIFNNANNSFVFYRTNAVAAIGALAAACYNFTSADVRFTVRFPRR